MKMAVSIPDELFTEADQLARRMKKSRSRLYADAMREYVIRHDMDAITEALNRVCDEQGASEQIEPAVLASAVHLLQRVEW